MVVEMLLLVLIAVVVFAFVLAPLVTSQRESEILDEQEAESASADKQPIHDRS